jgi:hypothetical protein
MVVPVAMIALLYAGGGHPTGQPARAGPLRFGPVTPVGGAGAAIDIAPDRRAFTTTFSVLEVEVGNGQQTPAAVSRSFPLVVPLTGTPQQAALQFQASGFVVVDQDTTATLTVSVNGHRSVKSWSAGTRDDFVQTVALPAAPGTDYRLTVALELRQRAGKTEATGHLNVLAIDAAIV